MGRFWRRDKPVTTDACRLVRHAPLQWALEGRLTLYTVAGVMAQARRLLQEAAGPVGRELSLDMQGITQSDSAGMVLIVGLQRAARHAHLTLVCLNVPAHLRDIADLSGLPLPDRSS